MDAKWSEHGTYPLPDYLNTPSITPIHSVEMASTCWRYNTLTYRRSNTLSSSQSSPVPRVQGVAGTTCFGGITTNTILANQIRFTRMNWYVLRRLNSSTASRPIHHVRITCGQFWEQDVWTSTEDSIAIKNMSGSVWQFKEFHFREKV